MQEIFVITPVVDVNKLIPIYHSMEHEEPIMIHWFVMFDLEQARYYHVLKSVLQLGQVERVNVHCLCSDKHKPVDSSHYNRNVVLDVIENHVIHEQPLRKECWVYQLEDSNLLHPAFAAYFWNPFSNRLSEYDLIVFNDLHSREIGTRSSLGAYAFRVKTIQGLRHSDTRNDFLSRLMNRCDGKTIHASESIKYKLSTSL